MPSHGSGTPTSIAVTVLRVTSGNFLEMFDFFLFGFYAKPVGDAFFPVHDPVSRLLLAFLSFGAAFFMRPLGAILLGAYVDRVGRRRGLIVTLAIMAAGTLAIAATPGFSTLAAIAPGLGYAAPLLVLAGRLAQGFSAGVELGGVSVYLAEIAPPGRRGFLVAWQSASQQVAVVLAALLGLTPPAELMARPPARRSPLAGPGRCGAPGRRRSMRPVAPARRHRCPQWRRSPAATHRRRRAMRTRRCIRCASRSRRRAKGGWRSYDRPGCRWCLCPGPRAWCAQGRRRWLCQLPRTWRTPPVS